MFQERMGPRLPMAATASLSLKVIGKQDIRFQVAMVLNHQGVWGQLGFFLRALGIIKRGQYRN